MLRHFILIFIFLQVFSFTCLGANANIVIYGDSRTGYANHRQVVNAILKLKPSVVFHTGDLVEDGRELKEWLIFNEITAELLKSAEFYPALGNHERKSPLFFNNFNLPNNERWYSLERNGIHFTVLDSNAPLNADSEQYKWLKFDLGSINNRIKFRVVILHHALFDTAKDKEDEKGLKSSLVPLFKRYGVNLVFSGHSHNYQRFFYDNIYYIVTAGGGAPLHEQKRTSPYLQKFIKTYHFCVLSVEDGFVTVKVLDINLDLIDEFKFSLP